MTERTRRKLLKTSTIQMELIKLGNSLPINETKFVGEQFRRNHDVPLADRCAQK